MLPFPKGMAKKADPFGHQKRWVEWKGTRKLKSCSRDLSSVNHKLAVEYLLDMEEGYNVASKGRRSYIRLNNIKQRLAWVLFKMDIPDITQATDRQVLSFFNRMKDGTLRRIDGKPFQSTVDYMKVFIAFWHWYQRRTLDREIPDITRYLSCEETVEKEFVYFTVDELKRVAERAKFEYRLMMWFLFDSGIRSPTELMSLKMGDFSFLSQSGIYELHIRDEYAKTFGRKIKLVLCTDTLRSYLRDKDPAARFFPGSWYSFKVYLKRLFVSVLGNQRTKGGRTYREIRPYDFRHSAACYWMIRYKKEAAFKYRFGWKENRMIHYYTKFLGMEDTVTQEDILVNSEAKSKLENELELQKQANAILEERLRRLEETVLKESMIELDQKLDSQT